jgi:tetratricopeptide (TPR) repeat protein
VAIDRVALLRNAETFLRQGKPDQAIAEYRRIVDDQPRDWNTANVLGDLYLQTGQIDKAVEEHTRIADSLSHEGFLSKAGALYKKILKIRPHDEHVLLQAAEIAAGQGLLVDARQHLNAVYEQRASRGDADGCLEVTIRLAALDPSAALELCEAAVSRGDWAAAVAILQQSVKKSPGDLTMLSRLIEVSAEGGRLDVAASAQGQLADAYLAAGSAAEARFIAEDLVARHPHDAAHAERLRRALVMLGETDRDPVYSARPSGGDPLGTDVPIVHAVGDVAQPVAAEALESTDRRALVSKEEADLSMAVDGVTAAPAVSQPPTQLPAPKDLEDVFADLREEATRRVATNNPDQEFAAGLAFYQAGQLDFAVPRLEAASRAPAHRFTAAATLGRIFLERGETWQAIEWFERAADAPAPSPADTHRLLYELADALEGVGEVARALAICLELHAEAGDYQDVATRVDRLAKVQARG